MKSIIFKVLCLMGVPAFCRWLYREKILILAYHRVARIEKQDVLLDDMIEPPENFEKQMDFLVQHYKVISLEKLAETLEKNEKLPPYTAVVTFDDAYFDNYQYTFPILKKHKIPATVFVATGYIETGRSFFWDEISYLIYHTGQIELNMDLGKGSKIFSLRNENDRKKCVFMLCQHLKTFAPSEQEKFLEQLSNLLKVDRKRVSKTIAWPQILEMKRDGIHFGAHTHSHRRMNDCPRDLMIEEIQRSKVLLDEKLLQYTKTFAYPFGNPSDIDKSIGPDLKSLGFLCAVTMTPDLTKAVDDVFFLNRIGVGGGEDCDKFCVKTSGLLMLLSRLKKRLLWK